MDASWSETGDRYMLKLFRDFLFHQVDATGAPWIDMAHIIQCLNKVCHFVICFAYIAYIYLHGCAINVKNFSVSTQVTDD